MTARRRRWWARLSRDTILFCFGLVGIIYETVFDKVERPTLLVLFAACIGLPAFLHADEGSRTDEKKPSSQGEPPSTDKPDKAVE